MLAMVEGKALPARPAMSSDMATKRQTMSLSWPKTMNSPSVVSISTDAALPSRAFYMTIS